MRDAQGNALALYDNAGGTTNWQEQNLYGSSRLGAWKPAMDISAGTAAATWSNTGHKQYELSNHLGNVLAVVTDKRILDGGGDYQPELAHAQDYYAFGSQITERMVTLSGVEGYRYGFNGKENDNDVKGEGNQQDYGMRIYDPRIGKFLSVDPITREYPELTPYQFASNRPIDGIDLDGLEFVPMAVGTDIGVEITKANEKDIAKKAQIAAYQFEAKVGQAKVSSALLYLYLLKKYPSMIYTGSVGAIFNGIYKNYIGASSFEVKKSIVSGFIGGSIIGLGPNKFLSNIITGATGGGVGEFVDQFIEKEFNNGPDYDSNSILLSSSIGAIANPIGGFTGKEISKYFSNLAKDLIAKAESKAYRNILIKSIKMKNPRIGDRELNIEINKQLKTIRAGIYKEVSIMEKTFTQAVGTGIDIQQEKTKEKLKK